MPSSDGSDSEEDLLSEERKLEEQLKQLRQKIEKKQQKKECEITEKQNTVLDQSAESSPPPPPKEDGTDYSSLLNNLPLIDFAEDEYVTSCDENKRSVRSKTKRKKKVEKQSRKLAKEDNDEPQEYTRTRSQCTTSGPKYEVKVSALLYLRATAKNWDFLLGTSVEAAGKFDDITLAYTTDSGLRKQMLIQLKHKDSRPISKKQLLADDSTKHSFSLLKYFKSFCTLRENFTSNAVLNRYSQFRDIDFVLCTNAAAVASGRLFTDADLSTCDSIMNMNGKIFNFARNHNLIQEFKNKYPSDVDDGIVKEFFDQFYIYSDQTSEKNLEKLLKEEFKTSYSISDFGASRATIAFVEFIEDWWSDHTRTRHLKRGEYEIKSGWENINDLNAESPKLEFKSQTLSDIKQILSSDNKIINCVTDVDKCGPACDKLVQSIAENSVQFLAVTLEDVESLHEKVLDTWPSELCPILVIKYETGMPVLPQKINDIAAQIKKSLNLETKSKLFLISKQGNLIKQLFPHDLNLAHTNLNITCGINDLTEECCGRVLQEIINFQGSNVTVESVLGKGHGRAIDSRLLSLLTYGEEIEQLGCIKEKVPSLLIKRMLTRNCFLMKSVFSCNSRDIFAVSGVTDEAMQHILETTEDSCKSETIVPIPYSENAREHQSQNYGKSDMSESCIRKSYHIIKHSKDFDELCKKYIHENIHWLEVVDGNFKWKKSKGNRDVIERHISPEKEESVLVNDVWDIPDRIVVVTGDSGMGKSTLLSQIAVNSKQKTPETCIIRINLIECGSDIDKLDLKITPEKACQFVIEHSKLLGEYNQSSSSVFFEYILKHTNRAVVLVDGFDEVYPEYQDKVVCLMRSFMKLSISKLWITSRSHMKARLESITGTMSFQLQPLSKPESEELIWQRMKCEEDVTASRLLLTTDMYATHLQLLGNPLFCETIAEAAQSNEGIRSIIIGEIIQEDICVSLANILEAAVNRKFEIYFKKYINVSPDNIQTRDLVKKSRIEFIANHEWSALLGIWSRTMVTEAQSLSKGKIKQKLNDFIESVEIGTGVTGMINTVRDGIPQFEHALHADYFLASWMAENYKGEYRNVAKSIFQNIIFDPQFFNAIDIFNDMMVSDSLPIHTAILNNDFNLGIPTILKGKEIPNINAKDKAGRTALHLALFLCNSNNTYEGSFSLTMKQEMICELLRLGAKLDILDDILEWSAFRYSNIQTVSWSIVAVIMKEKGITMSDKDELIARVHNKKSDALYGLANGVFLEDCVLVNFLLDNGVNVNDRIDKSGNTSLMVAAYNGEYDMLKLLITKCHAKPELTNNRDESPLHHACSGGYMSIVKYLINECKMDTDIKDDIGCTPILTAACGGHLNIIKYLREECKCDLQGKTIFGDTALCLAAGCRNGDPRVVKYLVEECGMNPKQCIYKDAQAHVLCANGNLDVIKYFVDKCQINPVVKSEKGICLLHYIIKTLSVEKIREFVSCYKPSLDITNNVGQTLFMRAMIDYKADMCEYLRINCTNIKNVDSEGNSALHYYIVYNTWTVTEVVVKWLVEECEIDANIVNFKGLTALQCAVSRSNKNTSTKCYIEPGVVEYLKTRVDM